MIEIVSWSMGIASGYIAAQLQRDGKNPVCVKSDTGQEDEDTYRFAREVEERFSLNVVDANEGRTLYQLFWDEKFIPARQKGTCSRMLKIEPFEDWLSDFEFEHRDATGTIARLSIGYEPGEESRVKRRMARWHSTRVALWFPLIEWNVTKAQCFGFFAEQDIKPPRIYRHFNHANCLPCKNFRQPDWVAMQFHYPERFREAMELENELQEKHGVRWMQDGPLLNELAALNNCPSRKGRRALVGATPAFSFDVGCDSCAID
jgi:3'-phosphoadenosine 5'-phosphosulfate sulfotransferase (PAPS reductase)/FAD synthetase